MEFNPQTDPKNNPPRPRADETIFLVRRSHPETSQYSDAPDQTMGCDHVGRHSQRDLPAVHSGRPSRHRQAARKAVTEVIAALGIFFSISIFLAHAFDVYRAR